MRTSPASSRALRDDVRKYIFDSDLQVGDRLPSEGELAAKYGVSRPTIREALRQLEQEGVVRAERGRGRFVTALQIDRPLTRLEGVTELLAARGYTATNVVLSVKSYPATPQQSELFEIGLEQPVIRLERARYTKDDLLVYSIDLFPRHFFSVPIDEIDWSGSLFGLLESVGVVVHVAATRVTAALTPDSAKALLDTPDEPWLVLSQQHADRYGRTVLSSVDYHRASLFAFNLVRSRDA